MARIKAATRYKAVEISVALTPTHAGRSPLLYVVAQACHDRWGYYYCSTLFGLEYFSERRGDLLITQNSSELSIMCVCVFLVWVLVFMPITGLEIIHRG